MRCRAPCAAPAAQSGSGRAAAACLPFAALRPPAMSSARLAATLRSQDSSSARSPVGRKVRCRRQGRAQQAGWAEGWRARTPPPPLRPPPPPPLPHLAADAFAPHFALCRSLRVPRVAQPQRRVQQEARLGAAEERHQQATRLQQLAAGAGAQRAAHRVLRHTAHPRNLAAHRKGWRPRGRRVASQRRWKLVPGCVTPPMGGNTPTTTHTHSPLPPPPE